MTINRDVIMDLLPMYMAGEASAATRALVEEYLKGDPALARRVREPERPENNDLAQLPAPSAPVDAEIRAIHRTRQLLRRERWLLGLTLFFFAVGASFEFSTTSGHLREAHFLVSDQPLVFGTALVLAALCGMGYVGVRRRARGAGF